MEEQNWIRGPIIGRGSTATVSLAITNSGDFFAVKSSELSSSALLRREESILSKLSSPYVVKYIGSNVTTENDKPMYNLQMEYVSGGSIHDLIKNSGGKLPEPVIRSYTRQILKGLVYLHGQGIVHCDVKSQNVMIGGETAKIVDLGCAKTVGENWNFEFSGTPAFMSPEVARGEEQSFPADVWALGCTVIEMATGSSPWPELNDVVAAIYKIGFTGDSPEIPVWLSDKGKDFMKNCLRKDPKQRWTVEELLQHPFLDEDNDDEARNCLNSSSPSTVLDQGFWDLCETSRTRALVKAEHEDTFANFLWDDDSLPADRIKKLSSGEPEWETNGWIEVRGDEEKRNDDEDEEDENCVEATSSDEEEEEEEVGGGLENWIWDQEDSLFLEYSPENNINYLNSFNNLFQEDIILYYYHHLEDGFVVSKVYYDDYDVSKNSHFFSHITTSCLEIPNYNRSDAFLITSHEGIYSDNYSKEQQVIIYFS
ncbi:mitogen-activated protein kinase kinase kinase 18 [Capsella rubella]|uniref:mitogen-activated protein kinase kinase kinase 18 n=1 Tax=Capsella rubella TaxID=81985 RepID=UPI000CD4BCA9|nr:mitogen-activated protein kinase kinase kinase 18 [Capsella rubella]